MAAQILCFFKVFSPFIANYEYKVCVKTEKRPIKKSHWSLNSRISISKWAFITVLA